MVQEINLGGRRIGMLPANHHSLAVGFWINGGDGKLLFTGDMGPCEEFWRTYEKLSDVILFIVECSFDAGLAGARTQAFERNSAGIWNPYEARNKNRTLGQLAKITIDHDFCVIELSQIIEF